MTTPLPQVWPTLRARDARALVDFLVEAFGFEATTVHASNGVIDHAELAWPPGGGIMLADARVGSVWDLEPGTFGAYAVTDEPDALFERAVARGADVLTEPTDMPYGSRECALRDPEGNRWSFGTYRGAPR